MSHRDNIPSFASNNNPIFIDDETTQPKGKYINTIATLSRLPAFQQSDHITKLLYSKFVVKGVRHIN